MIENHTGSDTAQVLDLPWSDQFALLTASAHADVALLNVSGANCDLLSPRRG